MLNRFCSPGRSAFRCVTGTALCMPTIGSSPAAFVAPASLLATSSLHCSLRAVAQYPSPRSTSRTTKTKKQYNYLTSERLVKTPRNRMAKAAIRRRDDVRLQRRRHYKEELLRDIEDKIKYLSPEAKRYVFFPQSQARAIQMVFKGNRVLPTRTFTRIYVEIIDKLTAKENRDQLIARMKEIGVEPPTAAAFRRYSDKTTGQITVPLIHSVWMERYFRELSRKYVAVCAQPKTKEGALSMLGTHMSVNQAYVLLYFDDESKVPSLRGWSHSLGPVKPEIEFVDSGRRQERLSMVLADSRREILSWGHKHVTKALAGLSPAEHEAMVMEALRKFEPRMTKLMEQLEFAAKVMLAINSLPEVRAMQTPSRVFILEKELLTVVKQKGVAFPPSPYSLKDWRSLNTEEQRQYYCFKKKAESRAGSGMQLFLRYCTRDYGIPRTEVSKRFARLTDEQQAALNYPFYYPITPKNATAAAFKKFYLEMCERYGLVRTNHSVSHGNRLFEATMREKWKRMPADERQRYYSDSILAAFPLLPKNDVAGQADLTAAHEKEVGDTACDTLAMPAPETANLNEAAAPINAPEKGVASLQHDGRKATTTEASAKVAQKTRKQNRLRKSGEVANNQTASLDDAVLVHRENGKAQSVGAFRGSGRGGLLTSDSLSASTTDNGDVVFVV